MTNETDVRAIATELEAMAACWAKIEPLPHGAQERVLGWLSMKMREAFNAEMIESGGLVGASQMHASQIGRRL